ncbi:MAG: DASS family sodium-coupled anion symporter [Veillonella sp.]|jgi:transporter, DASS family|uniref:DASS family sodium-coupled anion symporter n=1 Tax=Veillonella sp. TaxID=1926307 RepID=UPI0029053FAD|nr:DASS family sodium-coupled anion symporter [Veillonella sp.]MBS5149200.1 DASS family sodium-coupled anion symporter [Veillonella sp.]MDU2595302.1 DASS family sodium-coupled anion symporter [Veillonella sp.]MDU3276054.1 DASS family sodium-coupled anion symporter [Veillonella sp.]MDU6720122.1 DASS family sodium-coupled anion symporter [Veillonella sp.]
MKDKLWRVAVMAAIVAIAWFGGTPEGLKPQVWQLFGIYLATIVGLVLKPFPVPITVLLGVATSSILLSNTKDVLAGYSNTALWLIFAAFALSVAFGKTGLGHRIAYHLVRLFGSTTLRLGYVTAFLDLILSPATPSNTARAAGIVYPINLSIAEAVGSYPGETAKKAGAYLLQNGYFATKVTSFLFATAMAPNLLALDFITKLTGVSLNWAQWAAAMFVPGFIMLMLMPLIGYMYERPSVKDIDNKKIAADGLAELGPMKASEKGLIVIALLAITGWVLPTFGIKIDATAVAIVAMIATFVCGIISWDDLLKTKAAWNTLIWFGGILGLSSALTKGKFFEWLAKYLEAHMNFGLDPFMMLILISVISVAVRYFFASGTAYISAMLPVFLIVGINAGIDPTLLAFIMIGTNAYGGSVTHYGAAPGPIIFSAGYNNVKDWWTVGLISAVVCLVLNYVIGIPWWKIAGFM